MGQPLTLDEVDVSEEDAATVIYELRQDKKKLQELLKESKEWFKLIRIKAPIAEGTKPLTGHDAFLWEEEKVEELGKLLRQINHELTK